jgi:hypothetical protein
MEQMPVAANPNKPISRDKPLRPADVLTVLLDR